MKTLFAVLLLSVCAFAQGGIYNDTAFKSTGTPAGGASIRVCSGTATGTPCSPVASIYSDSALSITKGSGGVFAADANGNFWFYASPGPYQVQVTVGTSTYTETVVVPPDMTNATVKKLNNILFADQYPGATADVKINACLAAIPNGGICDALGFGATTQTIAATVEVGLSSKTVTLLLDPATIFQPSANNIDMFKVDKNGQLKGLHIVFPGSMVYAAHAVSVLDTITNNNTFSIDGLFVDALSETSGGTGNGYCLYIAPPTGSYVQLTTFKHIRCAGLKFGLYLSASGANTYINGNTFSDIVLTGDGSLLTFDTTATGLQIDGNVFSNLLFDGLGTAITYTGIGFVQNNTCSSCYIFDTTTPVTNGGNALGNTFIGGADHTITDAVLSDVYLLTNGTFMTSSLKYANAVISKRGDGNADYLNNTVAGGAHAFCDSAGNHCLTLTLSAGSPAFSSFQIGASGSTISDSRELIQSAHSCGTTTTCANTVNGSNRCVYGNVALSSGTPSTAVVSSITAFTSSSSYVCLATNKTTQANAIKCANTSSSSITLTGPNTVTDSVDYMLCGN